MNRNDTQSLKEALSALADSELSDNAGVTEAELVEIVCKDRDAMFSWQCTHITRDVLQADYTAALRPDFAERVSAQIAAESSLRVDNNYAEPGQVVSIADARQRSARSVVKNGTTISSTQNEPFKLWKPVAGLGLAASLAGATLLFSQLLQTEQPGGPLVAELPDSTLNSTSELQQTVATQDTGTNVQTLQASVPMESRGTRWRMDSDLPRNEQIEQRLNTLLTNHLEDASMGRVTGMMSHSRVVGYDSMQGDEQ